MRIVMGSDHAGLELKAAIKAHLEAAGHSVDDLGTHGPGSVDYPDFAAAVAREVAASGDRGILVCGTGQGVCMAANKVNGVRAAVVSDAFSAAAVREHNDANVLCLGQRVVGEGLALLLVDTFLATDFAGGRHARRVNKISALED
jgi:ribose 5-phosphate isomerase B